MPRLSRTYHEIVIKGPVVAGGGRTKFWYKNLRRAHHQKCHINTSKTWQLKDLHAAIFFSFGFSHKHARNPYSLTARFLQDHFWDGAETAGCHQDLHSIPSQGPRYNILANIFIHDAQWNLRKASKKRIAEIAHYPVQKDLKSASLHNESDPARTKHPRWMELLGSTAPIPANMLAERVGTKTQSHALETWPQPQKYSQSRKSTTRGWKLGDVRLPCILQLTCFKWLKS